MKRNYFDPEMKISAFSMEDVVTVSGEGITGVSGDAAETGYNTASDENRLSAVYSQLEFK